jgi:type IV secretory pathway TraG/TraD family ATPase VirD4
MQRAGFTFQGAHRSAFAMTAMPCCAPVARGQGRGVLIPTLLAYQGSVLALDPKDELANATAPRRAALGQRVAL